MSTRTEGATLPAYPDLAGKVAVVTGGSGGIGATIENFRTRRKEVG